MDEQELIRMLNARTGKTPRRQWNCPSDSKVASYLERRLEPKEKSRFEAHLADCDFCFDVLGALVRQQRSTEAVEVPINLFQQAIEAVSVQAGWRLPWKWLLVPALVTIAVVSAVLLRSRQPEKFVASVSIPMVGAVRPPAVIPKSPSPAEKQDVRKLTASVPQLQLLEPRPDSVVQREGLRFRWIAVADVTYYEIRVVNSEGNLVWHRQESNPNAQLPIDLALRPGKYFVWIHAYLNDGRTVKSDATAFWIGSSS